MIPEASPLGVLVSFGRDELAVSPRGEIDLATTPDLEAILDAVLDADAGGARRRLILDLGDVDFLGADGLHLIRRLASQLGASATELVVRSPSAQACRMLDMFGLGHLVAGPRAPISAPATAQQHVAEANAPVDLTNERVRRLQVALRDREAIAQAQGILMERDRISSEDAAAHLRRAARRADIPLRELAADIIAAAARPADPRTSA